MKTCSECGEEKELDQFHRNRSMSDGRLNVCKTCANAKRRASREGPEHEAYLAGRNVEPRRRYYAANRERLNERARARYAADPERHRAWMREDRAKDPAKVNARQRAWRAANPGKVKESRRRDYDANRERYAFDRLLRKHGITQEEWAKLWDAQDGKCYLCGDDLPPGEYRAVHLDHDHSCCGPSKSCRFCWRGLACRKCNILIGCANDDPARLRLVADNLEAVMQSLAERQAGRSLSLPLWDGDATNETATM